TEIPNNETVLLAGGGLGNAVLFSIARAFKEHGCKVVYFAGYKKKDDVFKRDEIEAGTDQVIWSVDAGDPIAPRRPQDRGFTGKESFVFSCFNQDQPLDSVDFTNLRARLRQNTVVEKMTNLWLTRLLAKANAAAEVPLGTV